MRLADRFELLRFARRPLRSTDFGDLQATFLVAAIATVLVIRTELWLTNYPQLGGGGLHIAHLLWGGVFMVIAIWMLLTYLGRSMRRPAALVGGVGFGFFIDELGKFITSDVNYFYKPAAALIYLIFIGLFLLSRRMRRRAEFSTEENVLNAIDLAGEAVRGELSDPGRRRALELLDRADPAHPMVAPARSLVEAVIARPAPPAPPAVRWMRAVRGGYLAVARRDWFPRAVTWVFAVWAILSAAAVLGLVLSLLFHAGGAHSDSLSDDLGDLSLQNYASLAATLVSSILVWGGILRLRSRGRLPAYRLFHRALIVSILVTRVFSFVESQFFAVFGLGIDLLLLAALRYVTAREEEAGPEAPGPRAELKG